MTNAAWNSDPELKRKVVDEVIEHRKADAIIQGSYLESAGEKPASGEYRGCALGCALTPTMNKELMLVVMNSNSVFDWQHEAEDRLGIPVALAYIYEGIFENLPSDDGQHAQFVVEALEAIPVGADLTLVKDQFLHATLLGEPYGLIQLPDLADDVKTAVQAVGDCYAHRIAGAEPTEAEWVAAGDLARAAWDAWDARDAWDAWDARAAWAAWDAWDAWDARAAWDAWDAWDARDARAAYYPWLAQTFIKLVSEAPVAAMAKPSSEAASAS